MVPEPTLLALIADIEKKDLCTAAHTWRVVLYARALAERAGLSGELIERITHGAALHDLGKLDVPDAILQKPGPLTEGEFAVMRRHTEHGYDRLRALGEGDELILGLVRHHHERMDGAGYPDGLAGERIPVSARYFSVIDSFDAMTSLRPYRGAVNGRAVDEAAAERALVELEAGIGSRYCEESVVMFADLYRTGKLEWIHRYFNDTAPLPAYGGGEARNRVMDDAKARVKPA